MVLLSLPIFGQPTLPGTLNKCRVCLTTIVLISRGQGSWEENLMDKVTSTSIFKIKFFNSLHLMLYSLLINWQHRRSQG